MAQFDPFLSESTFCVFVVVVLSLTLAFYRSILLRLIEAQDYSREIKKLNHIMKTKDARIENLESK